jgi:hypothetical protein
MSVSDACKDARGRPPRCSGCGYGRTMAARKRPTPEDAVTARRILLDGLARDADISALVSELVPLHPRNDTFPGEVFLRLASDALDWCGASREQPLTLKETRSGSCPLRLPRPAKQSSSTPSWPRQPSAAGPSPTSSTRSPGGRPTTSGSTPCTQRSPTSAPPPITMEFPPARHARSSPSARAHHPIDPWSHSLHLSNRKTVQARYGHSPQPPAADALAGMYIRNRESGPEAALGCHQLAG